MVPHSKPEQVWDRATYPALRPYAKRKTNGSLRRKDGATSRIVQTGKAWPPVQDLVPSPRSKFPQDLVPSSEGNYTTVLQMQNPR